MNIGKGLPRGQNLVAPVPLGGKRGDMESSVVFNTNEQKTATIGRVPRVGKMSSFYGVGDLNSSFQDRYNNDTKAIQDDGNGLKAKLN